MRKGKYRTRNVKDLDWEKLSEQVRGQRVVLGIDVAKFKPVACMMGRDEEILRLFRWSQPEQTWEVLERLQSLPVESLEVAMEASGTYGDALRERLEEAGFAVYQVRAKHSKDASELYDGVPSQHDPKAAAIVAWLHVVGKSQRWEGGSELQRDLRAKVDLLEAYEEPKAQALGRLEAHLARYWPELPRLLGLDSATLLELLIHYGGPRCVAMERVGAGELMRRVGGPLLKAEKIETVLDSAQTTMGMKAVGAEQIVLADLAQEIRRLERASRQLRRELEEAAQSNETMRGLSPVVGKVTSAVLVALAGEPHQYSSAGAYVKALGLNLRIRSSGKRVGQLAITKRGPGAARRWLYMAVLRLIQTDRVIRMWYQRKVKRDAGLKMKGVVALMRKVTRALWHVSQGSAFDSRLLFDTRRLMA